MAGMSRTCSEADPARSLGRDKRHVFIFSCTVVCHTRNVKNRVLGGIARLLSPGSALVPVAGTPSGRQTRLWTAINRHRRPMSR